MSPTDRMRLRAIVRTIDQKLPTWRAGEESALGLSRAELLLLKEAAEFFLNRTDSGGQPAIRDWLENQFHKAVTTDKKRLLESCWMLKVGHEKGDPIEEIMARCITSFVKGLIDGTQPVTVPIDSN